MARIFFSRPAIERNPSFAPGTHVQSGASNFSGQPGEGVCDKYHPADDVRVTGCPAAARRRSTAVG